MQVAYLYLRKTLSHHLSTNVLPELNLSTKPIAALNWVPLHAANLELEADLEMEKLIARGGEDRTSWAVTRFLCRR